jgi:tetratricopeptide (TPR) repeat protein
MTALRPITVRKQLASISEDTAFLDLIRNGSYRDIYQYAEDHLEEIKGILRERLQAQLGCEHTLKPEGSVYVSTAFKKRKTDDFFIEGKSALHLGDYRNAVSSFEKSAQRAGSLYRDIANNHRAYALAKLGEPLQARMILSPLCNRGFVFPSAYWNLACCMPAAQKPEQLAILVQGLNNAPHPATLHGAVSLATLLGHKHLARWLQWLPLMDAQLLAFCLNYHNMHAAAKETGFLRIGAYVLYGEPEMPDPMEYTVPEHKIRRSVDALLKLQQHAEVMEFWLRCRLPVGRKRYDYWKTKADYLEQFERRAESLTAFRSELYHRLSLLSSVPQFRKNPQFVSITRRRSNIFLHRCMSPELQGQGQIICGMIAEFEELHGMILLPCNPQIKAHFAAASRVDA